eukprot:767027-Hanusia_phi.AAC.1
MGDRGDMEVMGDKVEVWSQEGQSIQADTNTLYIAFYQFMDNTSKGSRGEESCTSLIYNNVYE